MGSQKNRLNETVLLSTQNICGSFEHPKHMLKLIGKNIFTILCSKINDNNFICPIFRFGNKEHAAQAICGVHGQVIMEQQVKCSWGKESNDPGQSQSSTPQMVAGNQSVSICDI